MRSPGAIDLHFHGAFGIDLMRAGRFELDELSERLWRNGVAGFCATTLSVPWPDLLAAVERLGAWVRGGTAPGALPLGIHLEGPYLSPAACGAHRPSALRRFRLEELEELRRASRGSLRIVTLAPERLSARELASVCRWASRNEIRLSLGHSRATESQAETAFSKGFSGVTHAWNALPFHHREPGPLGAAIGSPKVNLELIPDGIHVSPTVVRWTQEMHGPERTSFVSDCVPAALSRAQPVRFGNLMIRFAEGACRLPNGGLAGGGRLLPEAARRFCESQAHGLPPAERNRLLRRCLISLSDAPLRFLGQARRGRLSARRLHWEFRGNSLRLFVDSDGRNGLMSDGSGPA